jgi:dephospho-CoA kinase
MKKLKDEFKKLDPSLRLYGFQKPIIGLTGGIATGKSTVTRLLKERGLEVIDADQLVKSVYASDEAKDFIRSQFPEAWKDEIDFKILREIVFGAPGPKKIVEEFIYARLHDAFKKAAADIKDQDFYLYDVPLLFERGLDKKVDLKIVVYAPRDIQLKRLVKRDKSPIEVAESILDHQLDIEEKKKKADFVINNDGFIEDLAAEVNKLLLRLLN